MISSPPFVGIDPEHWRNSAWLVAGDAFPRLIPDSGRGVVRLLVEGGRCVKAEHTRRGPLDCGVIDASDLKAVAQAHAAAGVVALAHDLPERLILRAADAMTPGLDVTGQARGFFGATLAELGDGIRTWPEVKPPAPPFFSALNLAVKTALPANELLVIAVYSEDGKTRDSSGQPIVTSGILRFNSRPALDLCATTGALAGLAVRDWRSDWKQVNAAAQNTYGKIFVAVHLSDAVLPELFAADRASRGPAALLDLNRRGRLVIDPFPLRLRALLKLGKLI